MHLKKLPMWYFLFAIFGLPVATCFNKKENETDFEVRENRSNNEGPSTVYVIYAVVVCCILLIKLFCYCYWKTKRKTRRRLEAEVENRQRAQLQQYQHQDPSLYDDVSTNSRLSYPSPSPAPLFSTTDPHNQSSDSNWQLRRGPSSSRDFSNAPYPRQEYGIYVQQDSTATQTPQTEISNRQLNRRLSYNAHRPRPTVYSIPNFARPNIRSFPNYDASRSRTNAMFENDEPPPSWTNVFTPSLANLSHNSAKSVPENEEPPPSYYEAISSTAPSEKTSSQNLMRDVN